MAQNVAKRSGWITFAGVAALTVLVMFVFPIWAIAVLSIDFLVLFALLTRADEFSY